LLEDIRHLCEAVGGGGSQRSETTYRAEGKELLCVVCGRDISGVSKQLAAQVPERFWNVGAFLDRCVSEGFG
jgi:hypothetical protein